MAPEVSVQPIAAEPTAVQRADVSRRGALPGMTGGTTAKAVKR